MGSSTPEQQQGTLAPTRVMSGAKRLLTSSARLPATTSSVSYASTDVGQQHQSADQVANVETAQTNAGGGKGEFDINLWEPANEGEVPTCRIIYPRLDRLATPYRIGARH